MATARLVPSVLNNAAGTSYLTITDESNAFTNTDSTNYAVIYNKTASTSNRYVYLKGFNFSSIPNNAVVSDWSVKIKGYYTGAYPASLYLCNDTTTQSNATASSFGNSVATRTFNKGSLTWDTIKAMGANGANFGIRINCRRNSRNTAAYYYIYGAEIEVTYTVPNPRTVTTTLNGNGTIDPSGTETYYDGDTYELTITPDNSGDEVSVTRNGTDVTSQLVAHTGGNDSRVLGNYTLVSGSFNGSGASYFQGLVGKGVNNTQTTSNYYSGGNGTIAVFTYDVGFDLPASATITRVYAQVNGHAESTSQSSEYMCAQLISGSTNLSSELNFKSIGTSNSTQTIECTTLPTVAQLAVMKLQCRLGYYGGAINGATIYVEATSDSVTYTYSYTISGDATIVVKIGASQVIYFKSNGSWVAASAVYKKINGSWVLQSDLSNVFDNSKNYVKG